MRKGVLGLFLIVSLLIAVRFLWLDKFPPGFNHDEADVVLSAKNYWISGADISGIKFPISLFATKTQAGLAGLPSLITAPFLGIFNLNLFSARFIFVIVNIITGIFLSLVVFRLSKNKNLSIISFVVFLANPWSFIYARSLTEAPFALLFVLAGTYFLFGSNGKKIFFSLIFFIFAFFSYFGAKPLLPILVFFLLGIHKHVTKKTRLVFYVIYFSVFLLVFASYFIFGHSARAGELIFSNLNKYSSVINDQRRMSIDFLGNGIFNNKVVSLIWEMVGKYFGAYSPDYLFFGGDPRSTYRLGNHGMFYLLDGVFVIIGIYALAKQKKDRKGLLYFISVLFMIGPIGSVVSAIENSYIFRSFLLIPGFVILISLGIYYLIQNLFPRKRIFVILGITLVYLILILNFFNFYFFKFSITQQENNFFSERILTNYLFRSKNKVVVVVGSPVQIFQQYLFFSGYLNTHRATPIAESGKYFIDNILITSDCSDVNFQDTFAVSSQVKCDIKLTKFIEIQDEKDAGVIFKIYNDKMCSFLKLDPWRRFNLLSDYSVEKLTNANFCERWLNEK